MQEEIVSAKTAKLAKEKGFDWKCHDAYVDYRPYEKVWDEPVSYPNELNHNTKEHRKSAPTQSLLQKWLREVYNIHIIIKFVNYKNFTTEVINKGETLWYHNILNKLKYPSYETILFNSYEEALEAGLQSGLNCIK